MQDTQLVSVTVNFGPGGTVYGCGHSLDTMLYANGLYTEEEMWLDSSDNEHDAISWELKSFDFERYTLDRLNDMSGEEMLAELLQEKIPVIATASSELASSEYLPGDWLRFNDRNAFLNLVGCDRERITELATNLIGDWSDERIPEKLRKNLDKALEWCQEEAQKEWLHGDRSNDGVLARLAKELFGPYTDARVEWATQTDTVNIAATEDEWREYLDCDHDEREPLPSPEALAEEVKGRTIYEAAQKKEKRTKASEARKAAWEQKEAARKAQEEAEREAARERKRLKDQAS